MNADEAQRHAEFRADRTTGEWFTATPGLVRHARLLLPPDTTWQERLHGWMVR